MKNKKKRVYILEDNDDIREVILFLLADKDYEVHGYPTVKSFNEVMKNSTPDMVVLDVMLADGNGIEVCNMIKSNKHTNHIPILMMSANTQMYTVKEKCEAEDFISKPFNIEDFVKKIDQYLH